MLNRNYLSLIFKESPVATLVLDFISNQFKIRLVNNAYIKVFNQSEEYFIDLDFIEHLNNFSAKESKIITAAIHQSIKEPKNIVLKNISLLAKVFKITITPIQDNPKHVSVLITLETQNSSINKKQSALLLKDSEDEFKKIFDSSLDMICTIDEFGKFLKISKASEKIIGYRSDELINQPFINFVFEGDKELSTKEAAKVLAQKTSTNFNNRYVHKNGEMVPISWSVRWDENDKLFYCVGREATEVLSIQKALKESENKYKTIFEKNPLALAAWDSETLKFIDCNEEALSKYEYTREEFLNLTIKDIRPKEDFGLEETAVASKELFGTVYNNVWRHQKKNGEIMFMDISCQVLNYNGRKASLMMLFDITKKIKVKEQTETEKRDKEALINSTSDLIWSADSDLKLVAANKAFYDNAKIRFKKKIKIGDHILNNFKLKPFVIDFWLKLYNTALLGVQVKKEVQTHEAAGYINEWLEITINPIFNNNKVVGIACFSRIITDSKLAAQQIIDSQAKMEEAQRLAKLGNWEYDTITDDLIWSKEHYEIFETDHHNFLGNYESFNNFIDEKDRENIKETINITQQTGNEFKIEYGLTTKSGIKKIIQAFGYGLEDKSGKITRLFGTSQDITEIKLAEERIAESESRYRSFFENSMDGIILTDTLGSITSANPAAREILQMTEEEICKKGRNGIIDISDHRLLDHLEKRELNGQVKGELILIRKDGTKFPSEISSSTFEDANGVRIASMIIRDITLRKQSQKELKESNQRFEYAARATLEAIWDWSFPNQNVYWGNSFYLLFGYTEKPEQNNFNFWRKNIHPDDLKNLQESINKVIQSGTGTKWSGEYRFKKANGIYANIADQGFVIRDENGKAIRMVGAMMDITQKKKEEERLKLLESVIINTNDSIIITEAEPQSESENGPKIIYVNDAFTRMTGYTSEEIIGKTPRILQGPLSDNIALKKMGESMRKFQSYEITTINYKKNGEQFWINFCVTPVADHTGSYTHWIAVERDVTKQKESEEEIRTAYLEKNIILESIGDAFFAVNNEWTVTYWNNQAELMLRILKKDILGKNLWNLLSDSLDSETYIKYHQAMKEQKLIRFEDYFEKIDKWYEISIFPSKSGLSVYLKDITERVNYTKAIEKQNKKLQEIAFIQSHIVRAPLARIMGLTNLINELNIVSPEGIELLKYLSLSAEELDKVIKEIVSKSEEIK